MPTALLLGWGFGWWVVGGGGWWVVVGLQLATSFCSKSWDVPMFCPGHLEYTTRLCWHFVTSNSTPKGKAYQQVWSTSLVNKFYGLNGWTIMFIVKIPWKSHFLGPKNTSWNLIGITIPNQPEVFLTQISQSSPTPLVTLFHHTELPWPYFDEEIVMKTKWNKCQSSWCPISLQ